MTGFKKNFDGDFCKKNYQRATVFIFIGLVLTGILFSNKLSAQAPTASISLIGPTAVCEPSSIQIMFSATGTPPFSFSYNINGLPQTPINTNNSSDTVNEARPGVWTYSLTSVTDGLGTTVPESGAVTFTVNSMPQAWVTGDAEVCQFDPLVHIVFHGSNGTFPYTMTYTQNGVLDTITLSVLDTLIFPVSTSDPGTFVFALLSVHDNNGCTGTIGNDTTTVIVDQRPSAHFSINPGRVSNLEPTITINNSSVAPANSSWIWDFGDSSPASYFADPGTHTYKDTGTYTVKLQISTNSNAGTTCSDNISQNVRVFLPFSLYVPSAFSPNNDGINDVFTPKADGIKLQEYDMTIYDRWGNKLFYTNDLNKGWDGTVHGGSKIVPIDAYVYVINLVSDEDGKTYIFYGSVTSTLR